MKKILFLVPLLLALIAAIPVYAHANLESSSPAANAALTESPSEIRLRFTEPPEPTFSRITLRNSSGEVIETADSHVDPSDIYQLVLPLTELPDAFYTVTWRVISAADGHSSEGSFVFGVNMGVSTMPTLPTIIDESVSPASAVIRIVHFLAMCLAIGSIGFRYFVWRPTQQTQPHVERTLEWMMGAGWLFLGVASVLFLMLQTSTTADVPLGETLTHPALMDLLTHTIFGDLWLTRMVLWVAWGALLFLNRGPRYSHWEALALGACFLFAHSLFSHASATQDRAAVAADWLHLFATTLWVGGLMAFVMTLLVLRRHKEDQAALISTLVGQFSNYARVCVILLIITGLYASWLQVGSLEALYGTQYGQTLVIKLVLFAPLIGIAGVNLFWTRRQLQQGHPKGFEFLRDLIVIEIALTCGILIAAGAMTAGSPARGIHALQEAAKIAVPVPDPYFEMAMAGNLMIHLEITPGVVGENQFRVMLADAETGAFINDASLIRLRFENLKESYGQSELRPTFTENGEYAVTGANLSTEGEWRIRVNIQRPGEFDTVKDFTINAELPASAPPPLAARPPLPAQVIASLLMGAALLAAGGFFGGWRRTPSMMGSRVLAAGAILVGLVSLVTTISLVNQQGSLTVTEAYARPAQQTMTAAVYFTIENQTLLTEQLVSAETSIAGEVTLHETQVNNDIAEMVAVDTLDIPSFSTVEIAPNGTHVMLDDLTQDLKVGDTFELRLTFASGKTIPLEVTVKDPR